MLVTAVGVSLAVRIGMVGGRGTLAGADSSVVARTTGGGRVTTGIIVDETLEGVIVQKDRLGDVGGGLGNLSGLCVMGLIHFEGLFEIIYYLFDKGVLGREILRVFFVDT